MTTHPLGYVILYVNDAVISVAFYEKALGLIRRFIIGPMTQRLCMTLKA